MAIIVEKIWLDRERGDMRLDQIYNIKAIYNAKVLFSFSTILATLVAVCLPKMRK